MAFWAVVPRVDVQVHAHGPQYIGGNLPCNVHNMMHFVIAFSGYSGTGKDECAGQLVRSHGAIHTGLADPAKRHMADVYEFSRDQLFGPSHFRNSGDVRYPKPVFEKFGFASAGTGMEVSMTPGIIGEVRPEKSYFKSSMRDIPGLWAIRGKPGWPDAPYVPERLGGATVFIESDNPNFFLSPREALQLYCDQLNRLYLNTWVRYGIEVHKRLASVSTSVGSGYRFQNKYDRMTGVTKADPADESLYRDWGAPIITCFSDFRHRHEIRYARQAADTYVPVMVRVKNPKVPNPPYDHRSEVEQSTIPDRAFDFVVDNDGTLEDLYAKVDGIVNTITAPGWSPLPQDTKLVEDED